MEELEKENLKERERGRARKKERVGNILVLQANFP